MPDPMHGSWIFIKKREFGLSFVAYLNQTKQNNYDLSTVSKRGEIGAVLTCPKLAKWILNLNCSKSAKWTIWKFLSPVMEKGTSQLGVVTSLHFDHVTLINLYISSYREPTGATFIHTNA